MPRICAITLFTLTTFAVASSPAAAADEGGVCLRDTESGHVTCVIVDPGHVDLGGALDQASDLLP